MREISSESELVTDWLPSCLQGINDVTANLIGFIKELHCLRLLLWPVVIFFSWCFMPLCHCFASNYRKLNKKKITSGTQGNIVTVKKTIIIYFQLESIIFFLSYLIADKIIIYCNVLVRERLDIANKQNCPIEHSEMEWWNHLSTSKEWAFRIFLVWFKLL